MKQKATSKVLRAILIAVVLVVALVGSGQLDKSRYVSATTCGAAMSDFFVANSTYETARYSYFYNQPTSCSDDCNGSSDPHCIPNCFITRATAMANAEIGMLSLAVDTCTPVSIEQCDEARAMYEACVIQYDPDQYPTMEERLAVTSQLMACREASKIDTCQ